MACVAAPIIGGPRPLPGVTTRPPHLYTSIGFTYHTLKREEPKKTSASGKCAVGKLFFEADGLCLPPLLNYRDLLTINDTQLRRGLIDGISGESGRVAQ